MKAIVVSLLALGCLITSLVLMPFSEIGFAEMPEAIKTNSLLQKPIEHFAAFSQENLKPVAQWVNESLTPKIDPEVANDALIKGNYAYSLFLAAAMAMAAVAIILVGKEEAEEKTILPTKK